MMVRALLVIILFWGIAATATGQTEQPANSRIPDSRNPGTESVTSGARKSSKKVSARKYLKKSRQSGVKEYEERVRQTAKRYRQEQKLMNKPQYTNPLYYGHKKKPKIHRVGKRKFCKECEIIH